MAFLKKYLPLLFYVFIIKVQAQIPHGGKPFPYNPDKEPAPRIILRGFDIEKAVLKSFSGDALSGKKPFEFAWNHKVALTPENSGSWTYHEGRIKIWRLQIVSPGAYAVNVYFEKFRLEKACVLFAYSPDQSRVLGGFNELNNLNHGQLPLAFIPGESLVLELQVPADLTYFGEIKINNVGHDFINVFGRKNITDKYYGSSDTCEVDVNCAEGADWQIVKRAVCRIAINNGPSTTLCTGALINTTHNDARPYLITANHCINSAFKANNSVFYFDYESPSCGGPDDTISVYSLSGSEILATSDSLDFTLLKLSTTVPVEYKPYYAGWTIITVPASSAVCLHHPEGDVKKISIEEHELTAEYQTLNTPSWLMTESVANGFWRVRHWETGATEGGSSGAPVFNQRKKIIGNLTGGDATCVYPVNDYVSKFFMEWNYYSEHSRQLKCWLDSLNTGVTELNGSEPLDSDTIDYSRRFILFPNPADDMVTFETDSIDIEGGIISVFSMDGKKRIEYVIREEKRISMNIHFLEQGIYIFRYRNNDVTVNRKLLIIR